MPSLVKLFFKFEFAVPLVLLIACLFGATTAAAAATVTAQNFPDAINQPNFPAAVLQPGQVYIHQIVYKLSAPSSR
jgi:galactose mutarotase-like enzyme